MFATEFHPHSARLIPRIQREEQSACADVISARRDLSVLSNLRSEQRLRNRFQPDGVLPCEEVVNDKILGGTT
jgi:hypothetical protein